MPVVVCQVTDGVASGVPPAAPCVSRIVPYVASGPDVLPSVDENSLSSIWFMPLSSAGRPLPSRWWHEKHAECRVAGTRDRREAPCSCSALPAVKIGLVGGGVTIVGIFVPGVEPRGQSYVVGGL